MIERREKYIEYLLSGAVLLIFIIGCFFVLRPFIPALLLALILSFSTWPVYKWWEGVFKGNKTIASTVMTILLAIIFVMPVLVISISFVEDATNFVKGLRVKFEAGLPPLPPWIERIPIIGPEIYQRWLVWTTDKAQFSNFITPYLKQIKEYIFKSTPVIGQALLQILLSMIVCFFFYRNGEESARRFARLLRKIAGSHADTLIGVVANTTKGVVYGIIGTAAVQSLVATIGFFIAGVPGALLLGILTFFFAFIPSGPPFIWIPVTIWVFYQDSVTWGIFMGIWGMFGISGIDNIVKPYLISRTGHLPFLLILLGVFGGAIAFGFIGVFLGPALLALAYSLISEWTSKKDTPETEKTQAQ